MRTVLRCQFSDISKCRKELTGTIETTKLIPFYSSPNVCHFLFSCESCSCEMPHVRHTVVGIYVKREKSQVLTWERLWSKRCRRLSSIPWEGWLSEGPRSRQEGWLPGESRLSESRLTQSGLKSRQKRLLRTSLFSATLDCPGGQKQAGQNQKRSPVHFYVQLRSQGDPCLSVCLLTPRVCGPDLFPRPERGQFQQVTFTGFSVCLVVYTEPLLALSKLHIGQIAAATTRAGGTRVSVISLLGLGVFQQFLVNFKGAVHNPQGLVWLGTFQVFCVFQISGRNKVFGTNLLEGAGGCQEVAGICGPAGLGTSTLWCGFLFEIS